MTRAAFNVQMLRLSGLKFAPIDMETHWEALHDLPEDLLEAAVSKAQRESDEFPSPKMIRMFADALRSRVIPVGPEADRSAPADTREVTLPTGKVLKFQREWKYYCDTCSDTGWQSFTCGRDEVTTPHAQFLRHPWNESAHCGKEAEHLPHSWSQECICVATNPAVRRKRERDVQMASQRARSRGDAA